MPDRHPRFKTTWQIQGFERNGEWVLKKSGDGKELFPVSLQSNVPFHFS
jgi:hypothetical protein